MWFADNLQSNNIVLGWENEKGLMREDLFICKSREKD